MAAKETPHTKPRPIVRLGILLISHSVVVSVLCCISGIVALLLLPVLAKNTYISENALMPGSANPMLSSHYVAEADKLVKDLLDLKTGSASSGITLEGNVSCSSSGVNVVGIVRAPRGDGKEAIVLVTPYNSKTVGLPDALSVGLTYSVFSLLSQVTWLAKDIIWLVADSRYGEYSSVAAWLRDYQTPVFSSPAVNSDRCDGMLYDSKDKSALKFKITDSFRRAGTMAAALVVKVIDGSEPFEDTLSLYAEASNGQMPNLDLINIVHYLAVHRQGLHVKVNKLIPLIKAKWLGILGRIFEYVGVIARSLNPQWKFGIPASEYIDGAATLASSLYSQALGVPTGPHGAFRDYQVDAITLEFSPKAYSVTKGRHREFLLQGGRLIEGVLRSVNNLLEKFHQSFFLYLLTSPGRFVSVGVYMIPFALLVAPLPVMAASLYISANSLDPKAESNKLAISPKSITWLPAARKVLLVHFWGAIVSLLPFCINQMDVSTPTMNLAAWGMLSVLCFILLFLTLGFHYAQPGNAQWAILKSATLSAAFIGLCLMSVVNFATAEFGALLLVPMCLMIQPLKIDLKTGSMMKLPRAASNLILVPVGFPPVAFFLLKGALEGFHGICVGDFWIWVESLWAWNSATYLYITMVHLPCWLLCLHILLQTR